VVGEILLYFYIPMFPWKDFLMGRIRKFQKYKEERYRSGKFKKKQEGKNGGKKKMRLFCLRYVEVPILVCSPSVGNTLRLPLSCNPPSGEPTLCGNLPHNIRSC
jgi:hypothetical protein